ncbi:type VI secretion protein [Actinospica sp. MGRD01-02]|uniref:Type VI secretion protein n=1 Tax=Actinospica acidithermotolerans TaxID=2828514 RepID=A0A941E9P1_9ACTN|nr:type VI secretion protein [Actinospica acidithermotolerans]MBR7827556.1 type VI secretion protein [Actinospica acidithermotolerans]
MSRRRQLALATSLPSVDVAQLRPLAPDAPVPATPRERTERPAAAAPRRGTNRPYAGRAAVAPAPRVYRAATAQLAGLYPFLYGESVPPLGAYIGTNLLTGAAFSCHPIAWLHRGLITNPNILVTGIPGAGKSAHIKALSLRLMSYGVKTLILGDLKNEYKELSAALGVTPVELGPGLPARLNPLDAGPLGEDLPSDPVELDERLAEIHRRRLMLLDALLSTKLGRPLTPTEEAAISQAIDQTTGRASGGRTLTDPTLPQVWSFLRDPTEEMVRELRLRDVDELREVVRPVADALRAMVTGSLSGVFDGPTSVGLDFTAPIQSVDISRFDGRGDTTIAMILACVSSWGQAAIDDPAGPVRLVVRDELWRAMRIPALVRKLDGDLRLSRATGTIQILATHRLADFETVGAAGSPEAAIAANLIASCDVRICLAQDTAPLAMTRDAIGLTDPECAQIASWGGAHIGHALWKAGRHHSAAVRLELTESERAWFYTNQRMI